VRRFQRVALLVGLAAFGWSLFLLAATRSAESATRNSPTPTATPTATATPKAKPGATPTPTPTPPQPGTLPAGSTRKNPLPSSPTAPALFAVDPSTIDPRIENTLNLFGRNLSARTLIQIDLVPVRITDVPDSWHLLVLAPAGALSDGEHDIMLTNPDGQFDNAKGVLTARSPGLPLKLYLIGGALAAAFVLYRIVCWLTR